MHNVLRPSHGFSDAGDRHGAPGQWTDLKRDWQRWSRTERIVAECVLATVLIGGSLAAAVTSLF